MSFSPQHQPGVGSKTDPSSSFPHGDGNEGVPPATAHSFASQDSLAHRSCITCRRRKVRCNKRSPCSHCIRAGIECIFPPPGRAPRKTKRPPPENAELLSRLRQLESIVESAITNPNAQATPSPPQQSSNRSSGEPPSKFGNEGQTVCPKSMGRDQPTSLEHEFGRLVIDHNRSRYVSNRFWASLGDEVSCSLVSLRLRHSQKRRTKLETRLKNCRIFLILRPLMMMTTLPLDQFPITLRRAMECSSASIP
jgi:hypothetical protein